MLRAETTTTRMGGIDISHSTRFTVLLMPQPQRYMWTKLDMV